MRSRRIFSLALYFLCAISAAALQPVADTMRIGLPEAIARARVRSVNATVALNEFRQAYWEYRAYKSRLLPEIGLQATLPAYYKQYSPYMDAEGNYSFVGNNYLDINATLSLKQKIWPTGGTISLNSGIDFLRQISGNAYSRYKTIPVALTIDQPLFGVNETKWDRKIEPVRYTEAKAELLSATEDVAITAINLYFNLLMAHENLSIAEQNHEIACRLHEVATMKREMGQISKNDLLQMELNVLDALGSLTQARNSLTAAMFALRSFLDYDDGIVIEPSVPQDLPLVEIKYARALELATDNNKLSSTLRRRQLEADYAVAVAKADMRKIDVYAQIGFTGTDGNVADAYTRLRSNQVVEVGISLPLVDWGRRRGKVKSAISNREVVENRNRLDKMNFEQDLFVLVDSYDTQRQQLDIARKAVEIADRRYDTNVETYMIGRISTLDLNDSQVKKDSARQDYITQLYKFWLYYYQLRSITLWDFATDSPLETDFELLVK